MEPRGKKRSRSEMDSDETAQKETSRKKQKPIRDLINELRQNTHPGAQEIVQALEYTKIFLLQTSLQFQSSREKVITHDEITKILDSVASKLTLLEQLKTKDDKAQEILAYCKNTIEEQLCLLHEFNDKIFHYYQTHDNSLKRVLEETPSKKRGPGGAAAAG